MKPIPLALQQLLDSGSTFLSAAIKVTRADGEVFAFTSAQQPVDSLGDGVRYEPSALVLSDIVASLDMSVGNMDLALYAPHDDPVFNQADIFGGVWSGARFEIFEYSRRHPAAGKIPRVAGVFGDIAIVETGYKVELRDWMQFLQQPVGEETSKNCRNRLGDARCRVDLDAFTVTGTVTSVSSNQVFRDSSRSEAVTWFAEGTLLWTSGQNAGYRQKIKTYAADGTFTLMLPMFSAVLPGDTYEAVAGCMKRHDRTADNPSGASDCVDKFNNILNFRGEPHAPGTDEVTQSVTTSV